MYLPKHFEERNVEVLHALIRSHPLGTWVTQCEATLSVNHIPFLVESNEGKYGRLIGHVARANPIWKTFSRTIESVVIFQGPQGYITPSWYPSKRAHGKAVPTWNYAVAHAFGVPRAIEDLEWLHEHVKNLSDLQESDRPVPWKISDAPRAYIETMLKAIVGIEIPLSTVIGKWKMSQNKTSEDRLGTIEGLRARGDAMSQDMAALVERKRSTVDR